MNHINFLEKQNRIYSEFRDISNIKIEGLKPKLEDNKGGYIIALRHPNNIISEIDKITSKVNEKVTCIKYDKSNIHTTLATYNECIGFIHDKKQLELIASIAEKNITLIKGLKINYYECLINQDTAIVAGIPNEKFIEYIDRISKDASKYNIEFKMPWGAHITISRFLRKTSYDKTLELLDIVKENKEIGISVPISVDIGYYKLSKESFKINVYKSINL